MEAIDKENYFNKDITKKYFSASLFKDFLKCPACAVAKIRGEYEEEVTKPLMVGSYIDAYFSGEMKKFEKEHPEIFNVKTGELKSDYKQAEEIIRFIEKDELMMKYLSGEHQVVVTGEIAGVPYKGKIDSYFPDKVIVDQKIMKDLEPVWDDKEHCKKNLIDYWGYSIQGAIYRELVRQKTGKNLPFILAITTKERVPRKALIRIDDEALDEALKLVQEKTPLFKDILDGKIPAERCEECDYCRSTSMVTGIRSYHTLDPIQPEEIEY